MTKDVCVAVDADPYIQQAQTRRFMTYSPNVDGTSSYIVPRQMLSLSTMEQNRGTGNNTRPPNCHGESCPPDLKTQSLSHEVLGKDSTIF